MICPRLLGNLPRPNHSNGQQGNKCSVSRLRPYYSRARADSCCSTKLTEYRQHSIGISATLPRVSVPPTLTKVPLTFLPLMSISYRWSPQLIKKAFETTWEENKEKFLNTESTLIALFITTVVSRVKGTMSIRKTQGGSCFKPRSFLNPPTRPLP